MTINEFINKWYGEDWYYYKVVFVNETLAVYVYDTNFQLIIPKDDDDNIPWLYDEEAAILENEPTDKVIYNPKYHAARQKSNIQQLEEQIADAHDALDKADIPRRMNIQTGISAAYSLAERINMLNMKAKSL